MKKILETKRVLLRELNEEDYKDLAEILQDETVMYAYAHAFEDREVEEWLKRQLGRYQKEGVGLWAVIDKVSGAWVGQVGLTWQQTDRQRELEIGYLLKKRFWHMGYATEAAEGCKQYAFEVLQADRVVSIIRETNLASRQVAERLGMKEDYRFVKHYYGIEMPHIVYAIQKRNIK